MAGSKKRLRGTNYKLQYRNPGEKRWRFYGYYFSLLKAKTDQYMLAKRNQEARLIEVKTGSQLSLAIGS